jgi:hypothetical protein
MFSAFASFIITTFFFLFPGPPVTSPFVGESPSTATATTIDLLIQNPAADQDAFEINTFNFPTLAWRVEPFVLDKSGNQLIVRVFNLRPNSQQRIRVRSVSWTRPASQWVLLQTTTR